MKIFRRLFGSPFRAALAAGIICAGLAGWFGATYASIPDSAGVVHGCYTTTATKGTHALTVLNSAKNTCPAGTTPITWSQTGPQGPPGPAGVNSLDALSGTPCNTRSAAAGTLQVSYSSSGGAVTSSTGTVSLICVPSTVYTLTLSLPNGDGTVTSSPAGVDCGSDGGSACSAQFVNGTSVALTESAASGDQFEGWSGGGCLPNVPVCTVFMTTAQSVSATFGLAPNPPSNTMQSAVVMGNPLQCAQDETYSGATANGSNAWLQVTLLGVGKPCANPTIGFTDPLQNIQMNLYNSSGQLIATNVNQTAITANGTYYMNVFSPEFRLGHLDIDRGRLTKAVDPSNALWDTVNVGYAEGNFQQNNPAGAARDVAIPDVTRFRDCRRLLRRDPTDSAQDRESAAAARAGGSRMQTPGHVAVLADVRSP